MNWFAKVGEASLYLHSIFQQPKNLKIIDQGEVGEWLKPAVC